MKIFKVGILISLVFCNIWNFKEKQESENRMTEKWEVDVYNPRYTTGVGSMSSSTRNFIMPLLFNWPIIEHTTYSVGCLYQRKIYLRKLNNVSCFFLHHLQTKLLEIIITLKNSITNSKIYQMSFYRSNNNLFLNTPYIWKIFCIVICILYYS